MHEFGSQKFLQDILPKLNTIDLSLVFSTVPSSRVKVRYIKIWKGSKVAINKLGKTNIWSKNKFGPKIHGPNNIWVKRSLVQKSMVHKNYGGWVGGLQVHNHATSWPNLQNLARIQIVFQVGPEYGKIGSVTAEICWHLCFCGGGGVKSFSRKTQPFHWC